MSMESKNKAGEFFDRLEVDEELQANIKQGIEKLAKANGFNVTEQELSDELRKRWEDDTFHQPYSEPPGF
jgi:Nif11 domain